MTSPDLATHVKGKGRHYLSPKTGQHYPSVTNILDILAKPALLGWARKRTALTAIAHAGRFDSIDPDPDVDLDWLHGRIKSAKDARRRGKQHDYLPHAELYDLLWAACDTHREDTADLGTILHEAARSLADRDIPWPSDIPDDAMPVLDHFVEWVSEWGVEIVASEVTVISDTHRYAGTFDVLLRCAGFTFLADYKTGKGVWPEAALQLNALAGADYRADTEEPLPGLDGALVLHLTSEGVGVVPVSLHPRHMQAFLGLRAAWEFATGGGSDVALLNPVTDPARLKTYVDPFAGLEDAS